MEENQLLSVLGSPAIPHRSQRDDTSGDIGLTCVQNINGSSHHLHHHQQHPLPAAAAPPPPLARCYSSLQMAASGKVAHDMNTSSSHASPSLNTFSITPAILSESCQRRNRKANDLKQKNNKQDKQSSSSTRCESMINFSHRVSMITGERNGYHGNGETDVEEENELDENISVEYEAVRLRNRSRIGNNNVVHQSPSLPHGHRRVNQSKVSQQQQATRQTGSPSLLSSLISLDRRLIGCGAPGIPAHRSNVNGSPAGTSNPSTGNDSVRRSALLRSASGIAAAQAAAAAAASASIGNFTGTNSNNAASYHPHGISTLGPNQQFNYPPLPPIPGPEVANNERCVPVPRSLQVSPALTQRSLYAQHLFSQPDSFISPYCTTSKVQSNRSSYNDSPFITNGIRSSIGWMKDELLRSSTASRMMNCSDDYNNSVLKSATSEFSFVRPDSPLTLPYNKSRSFYGRPVSVSSGVITNNQQQGNFNNHCPPPLPPPRPPLPKQLSLEESSTLFRCSAAATASSAAARASDRAAAKERIAAIRKAAAASASFDTNGPTSASSTSSSSGVSSARSSLPEHHSQSLLMHLSCASPRPVSYGYQQQQQQTNMHQLKDTSLYDGDFDVDELSEYEVHPQNRQQLYPHQQQVPLRSNSSIGLPSNSSNCNTGKVNDRRKNRMNRILEKSSTQYAQ